LKDWTITAESMGLGLIESALGIREPDGGVVLKKGILILIIGS